MKHIVIERPNGIVTMVRSEVETGSDDKLIAHEEIINELFTKLKKYTDLPTEKQLRKSAKEYDRSAHAGHYAGEDPSYHWIAGAEHVLRKLKKP